MSLPMKDPRGKARRKTPAENQIPAWSGQTLNGDLMRPKQKTFLYLTKGSKSTNNMKIKIRPFILLGIQLVSLC